MISVILATKNGGSFLERSVNSVLAQAGVEFEIIIISDGSTDNTVAVAQKLASDPRVKVIELKENKGPGTARNLAIDESEGEYIAIIDDDDVWLSNEKLKTQKEYLDDHKDTVIVGASRVEFIREEPSKETKHVFWLNQEKDTKKIRQNMLSYNPIITSSVLFRKDIFMKAGCFKDMRLAEDYDLWLRMGKFGKIANVDGADTQYTIRDSGASRSNKIKMCKAVIQLVNEYKKDYPNYMKAIIKGYLRLYLSYKDLLFKNIFK